MNWSPTKFRQTVQQKHLTYEEIARKLITEKGWNPAPELIMEQLTSLADNNCTPNIRYCEQLSQILGVDIRDLLDQAKKR